MSMQLPRPHPAPAVAAMPSRPVFRAWRALASLMVGLLFVQFIAGMVVNLYVQLPATHPGSRHESPFAEDLPAWVQSIVWALGQSDLALRVHVTLGLLLGAGALALLGVAIAARRRVWVVLAVIGVLSIAGAGANGAQFLTAGGQALNSLGMALDFALGWIAYGAAFTLHR